MKVLVFGSANIDRTYSVDHVVVGGETISSASLTEFCGGKGFNQAVAFSRAGCEVFFAGAIGPDGDLLENTLKANKVNTDYLKHVDAPTGHAIIQVTSDGTNSIIISAGANGMITHEDVDSVLSAFSKGDLVVLQNEISSVDYIIDKANELGLNIALNPSPFDRRIESCDLNAVDFLMVNEIEGAAISGESEPEKILQCIHQKYQNMNIVLTLGECGSCFMGSNGIATKCSIYHSKAVDTTAAGDTFTGYFLSEMIISKNVEKALKTAAVASGISVSRNGASTSIPYRNEVLEVEDTIAVEDFPM